MARLTKNEYRPPCLCKIANHLVSTRRLKFSEPLTTAEISTTEGRSRVRIIDYDETGLDHYEFSAHLTNDFQVNPMVTAAPAA